MAVVVVVVVVIHINSNENILKNRKEKKMEKNWRTNIQTHAIGKLVTREQCGSCTILSLVRSSQ